ncbi:uncharacterized protein HKW66_Vig0185900 [Vigna angularis]|uniref:Importin N-terminal domain-containing protein n=1 Tax=Phaseolus angularis TaxID=3914 RepID=A0A8T0KYJ7_PHAAN|nr:uncharacterized protein HKW66_Vig0185900 [Vigna angularis]
METLAQLEAMCERLYNSQDSVERAQAESTLKCFSLNSDYISQCQYVLDNASSPYALMLASSSLLKQVTEQSLPLQLRIDIRNYLINYLASKGPELEPFVLGSLIQLFCRITKFGWLDDDKFREVVKEAMNFLSQALECLLRLASIRRSLFPNDTARMKFLSHLMRGTKEILQTGIGLSDHDNYHGFCRLLGRFKLNYQLSELVNAEGYSEWIHLVAEFTLKSLHSWKWTGSSVYYLLNLWSRSVASVRYLKGDKPNLLDEYVPKVIEGFVSSRFDSLQVSSFKFHIDMHNTLFSEESHEILDAEISACVLQLINISDSGFHSKIQKEGEEAITAVLIGGGKLRRRAGTRGGSGDSCGGAWRRVRAPIAAIFVRRWSPGRDASDGVVAGRFWCSGGSGDGSGGDAATAAVMAVLAECTNDLLIQRYEDVSKQRLDRAILTFFQHFRKCYIGDQIVSSSKLYTRLSELLGLHDHLLLLNVIVGKMITNLKCYTKRDLFPFIENWECFRSRTTLYYTIGMLIFLEDNPVRFKSTMEPFSQVLARLESTPDALFQSDAVKFAFIGLMRDLRGIAMATNSRRTYGFLFDWLYPAHMPLLLKGITHYADIPEVTTPLLKLVAELVLNKSQRLNFEYSSPNGILLFREVSKLIVAYGSRILPLPNKADMYTSKYKGMSLCLIILTRAISGSFVNFGIFELYGDRALVDALDIIVKMILSIPLADIFAYRKVAAAYFAFLDSLFSCHLSFVLSLDKTTFMLVVGSLESGLKDLSDKISSQCAYAIDNLATFYFTHVIVGELTTSPSALNVSGLISDCAELFSRILRTLFEVVIFEDRGNQWTLSRAILSIMLISEEMFTNVKAQILASYVWVNPYYLQFSRASSPPDQHQRLSSCFDKLMTDVTLSLDGKNRDKFSQNLTKFKTEFCAK